MPDNDEFRIQLKVAEKVYPIFCNRSEEGLFRKAATVINDTINRYSLEYGGPKMDKKDLLTMAVIHISRESFRLQEREDKSSFMERIELLDHELEEYIQKIQSSQQN